MRGLLVEAHNNSAECQYSALALRDCIAIVSSSDVTGSMDASASGTELFTKVR